MNKDSNDDDASCNRQADSFYNISGGIRIARGGGGRGMYAHADGDFHRFHGKYAPITDTAAGQADISDSCSPAIGVDSFGQSLQSSGGSPRYDYPCADVSKGGGQSSAETFVAITWNACGMASGTINDMASQMMGFRWDAVMIQEGPMCENNTYCILEDGHALFLNASGPSKRSVGILINRKWVDLEAKLSFHSSGHRTAYAFLDYDCLRICMISSHLDLARPS